MTVSACAGLLIIVLGCGPSGPKLYPASGKLTIGGAAAQDVTISLSPVDPVDNPMATATVGEGGSFKLQSGVEGKDGVAPGKYKVVLIQQTPAPTAEAMKAGGSTTGSAPPAAPEATFHSRYLQAASSDKEVTIEKKSNTLNIDVEGPEA